MIVYRKIDQSEPGRGASSNRAKIAQCDDKKALIFNFRITTTSQIISKCRGKFRGVHAGCKEAHSMQTT